MHSGLSSPRYSQPPYPVSAYGPAKKSSCLWPSCGIVAALSVATMFVAGLVFTFMVLRVGDRLSSPANVVADRFLAHLAAGGSEAAYQLTSPSFQEQHTIEDFKSMVDGWGLGNDFTWEKRGSTYRTGGLVRSEVLVHVRDGTDVPLFFKIVEIDDQWKVLEISQTETD